MSSIVIILKEIKWAFTLQQEFNYSLVQNCVEKSHVWTQPKFFLSEFRSISAKLKTRSKLFSQILSKQNPFLFSLLVFILAPPTPSTPTSSLSTTKAARATTGGPTSERSSTNKSGHTLNKTMAGCKRTDGQCRLRRRNRVKFSSIISQKLKPCRTNKCGCKPERNEINHCKWEKFVGIKIFLL